MCDSRASAPSQPAFAPETAGPRTGQHRDRPQAGSLLRCLSTGRVESAPIARRYSHGRLDHRRYSWIATPSRPRSAGNPGPPLALRSGGDPPTWSRLRPIPTGTVTVAATGPANTVTDSDHLKLSLKADTVTEAQVSP